MSLIAKTVVAGATAGVITMLAVVPAHASDNRNGSHSCPSGRTVSITTYVNGNATTTDVHIYTSNGQSSSKNFTGGGTHVSSSPFQSASWAASTSGTYYQGVSETCLN